jgi:2-polyprenyl-3-methyl-5-hydroxy-6-metoxy-1,4-benzoquinol methylase
VAGLSGSEGDRHHVTDRRSGTADAADAGRADTVATRWRDALEAWRIPPEILANATASPWTLPVAAFAGRARSQLDAPSGWSYEMAVEALPERGTVLDVGAGAGAASLALRGRAGRITAVDESAAMLATFSDLAAGAALPVTTAADRWPDIAPDVEPADVVVCHHVLYNVPDLDAFVVALTAHARHRVVVEITARHPMSPLNPLWMMLHGLDRPAGPIAADAIEVIAATGVEPRWHAWRRPITPDGTSYSELIASTCRRLCLGPDRLGDVEAALRQLGVRPDRPYLGGELRELVTIWWPPTARI